MPFAGDDSNKMYSPRRKSSLSVDLSGNSNSGTSLRDDVSFSMSSSRLYD